MLVDSHCHLDFPDFADDLPEVIDRAAAAGVGAMLTIGTRLSRFPGVRRVAEGCDRIWCSVGIHPHEAENESGVAKETLMRETEHPKVVGIGETGLDYFYEHAPRDKQRENFRAHIGAARETGLPLIVHAREADDDIIAILRDEHEKGAFPGLIHCFSSGPALAECALDLGLYISFSGIVTFKKAEALRDIARDAPLDRILVETDAPYLAPVPKRGKRNEPAYVAHTAARLAELREMSPSALAEHTTENFFTLFRKIDRPAAA
ncbi:MAG: TatD family hydrolase [Alphaproteobacteria bacterium]